jgi:predicted AlkP superfamily phosphohydrolase/phosphomutase
MRPRTLPLIALLLSLLPPPGALAWGFTGHRLVNARAVETLPSPLRALFEANATYLGEHSVDPDLWRSGGDRAEAPNHFLDADFFGAAPWPAIPRDEAEHLARHGEEAREQGRVPWRITEQFEELRRAFAAGDSRRALRVAAILGHYVSDAHVPLHAVVNYNGQNTGQHGIHSRWESQLVDRFSEALSARLDPAPAEAATEPLDLAFAALRESFDAAEGVLASDRESTLGSDRPETPEDERYDDAYFERLFELEGDRLSARLALSVERIGALWLGAWVAAGRPELPEFRYAYVRGQRRGVLLSLDGAGERLIAEAISRGAMPELERLRRRGATADGVITAFPAKTAPGHAALFTGAWSPLNGIGGNWHAVPGGSILEQEDGYRSDRLAAEPVWVSAARQGLDVTVASAPQAFPFEPYLDGRRFGANFGRRLTLLDGYDRTGALSTVVTESATSIRALGDWGDVPLAGATELGLEISGVAFRGLLLDDPADPAAGYDTLLLSREGGPIARLEALPPGDPAAFVPVTLPGPDQPITHVRLFELAPDGSALLLFATAPYPMRSSRPGLSEQVVAATGGFVGNGASWAYGAGRLGRRIDQGGDGTAEERYLETVALAIRQFERLNAFCIEETGWDLLVTYLPYPDEVFHAWLGLLEPSAPGHDPELAARIRPYLDRALRMADDYVKDLARAVGPEVVLAVGSDHGQIGVTRRLLPNAILAAAGLLVQGADGLVDPERSRAMYHPGNNGFVLVNGTDRGGPVTPWERDEVLRAAREALLAARDPQTGEALVLDVLDPQLDATQPRLGGPTGGDLYLVAAPGYDASARLGDGRFAEPVSPRGVHLFGPERPEMRSSFTVSGPGVAPERSLGVMRQVDVAPTLSALLGLDPPRDAEGSVETGALAWPEGR